MTDSTDAKRRLGPGRRRSDVDRHLRNVSWRDFRRLRFLLIAMVLVPSIVGGVVVKVLFEQVQGNRVTTTRAICAAVDAVRVQTRDGFHTVRGVARGAGLRGPGLIELHGIVEALNHPRAAQNCRVIVRLVRDVAPPKPGPNP